MTPRARALAVCLLALLASAALAASPALACLLEAPVPQQEGLGGGNDASPNVHRCYKGEPVNCATGNQTEEQTDLVLGGRAPVLAISRTYNSQAAAEAKEAGLWGYGWSGPYGSHLEFNKESGAITVVQENGATAAFALEGGKYVPGAWIQATLVKEGENYLFTLPNQEKLTFNSEGKLTIERDRNNNAFYLSYVSGKLVFVEDLAGRDLAFGYTGSQVTSVEDPMGHKVKYAYESGNLTSVTLPGEETPRWKFKYDASHQLTEMTDGRGGVTKTEYDAVHRVKKQTDPMERVIAFAYGEAEGHKTTTITEPNGSTTFEKFNEAGEPLEVIKAKGTGLDRKANYEYNSAYELTKATDALGHSTTYQYSAAGDRTLEKDAEGDETKWTYDATHDVETETTPKGEKTTYKRDVRGNVEVIERLAPGETIQKATFKFSPHGDVEFSTDPLGHESKFEYAPYTELSSYGNLKAAIDPEGDKTTWTYNIDGQQLTQVSPRGNEAGAKASEFETKTERDAQGRPIKVTDPLGHETKYAYDKNGNLESVTDALGHTTKYAYDAANERTEVKSGNGNTTKAAYDSMGQLKSRTDGKGYTTKYEHNALEQPTETIDPLERKSKQEYDTAGNLKKTEDALGRTITYSYDAANRLKEVNYSEEASHDVTYKYDKDGNIVEMTDGTGTTTRVYDQLDRLTEVTNGNKEVVKYKYDLGNKQTELVYPNGKSVTQAFDKAGRLEKVTDWLKGETKFFYNRDSALKTTTFPIASSNKDESEYNTVDQLAKTTMLKGAETLASLSYTREKLGQLETATQTGLPGVGKAEYGYDESNRLTKGAGSFFEYDAANNPTKIGSASFTYDKASELEKGAGVSYSFNKMGDRIKATPETGPATTYGYDQPGNLISVKRPEEGKVAKIEDTYAYDGLGLRASQVILGTTNHMVWDIVASPSLLLTDGASSYIYGPGGAPVEQISSKEEPFYLHHDQQGSTRLLTGTTGKVEGTYTYTPYGGVEGHTGTVSTSIGYGGQYTSGDTGLIYLRARVYDSSTAQFLSVDPMVATTNAPYSYAGDNPTSYADPAGLAPYLTCGGDAADESSSDPTPPKKKPPARKGSTVAPADATSAIPHSDPGGGSFAFPLLPPSTPFLPNVQSGLAAWAETGSADETIGESMVGGLVDWTADMLESMNQKGKADLLRVGSAIRDLRTMLPLLGPMAQNLLKTSLPTPRIHSEAPTNLPVEDLPMEY